MEGGNSEQPDKVSNGGGSGGQGGAAAVHGGIQTEGLRETDHCKQPGEIGGLLRREGLYWSNLANWRKQRERGELSGLTVKKRGPTQREKNPLAERVRELERDNSRLKRRAERAEGIVELQKSLGDFRDRTGKERRDRLMVVVRDQRSDLASSRSARRWELGGLVFIDGNDRAQGL
jgi:hypothetical protein